MKHQSSNSQMEECIQTCLQCQVGDMEECVMMREKWADTCARMAA